MLSIPIVSSFDNKGIKKAEQGFSKLEDNAKRASATLRRVGQAAIIGFSAAAGAIAALSVDVVRSASDLGESVNAVKVTFGDASTEILKLSEAAAKSVGLSKKDFNSLAVQFASFATKIAGKSGNVAKVLEKLTTRAADFASVMNIDVSEAAAKFQSGLAGEAEPLKKFGIDISDAAIKAYAYAKGIAKTGAALTEEQKVLARYGAIMEQTDKTAGDFANTSDSLANRSRILKADIENLKAKLGESLLPIFEKVLIGLTKIVDGINLFSEKVKKDGFAKTLKDYIGRGLDWLVNDGIPLMARKSMEFSKAFIDYMAPRWKPLAKKLGELLRSFANWMTQTAYPWIAREVPKAMKAFSDWFDKNVDTITDGVAKMLLVLTAWVATEGAPAAAKVGAALFVAMFKFNKAMTSSVIEQFLKVIGDVKDAAIEKGTELGKALGKGIANGVISGVNKAIDAINYLLDKAISASAALGPAGFVLGKLLGDNAKIPQIPALANGGIVSSPTLALIGEAGPEAVVPLDRMGSMGGGVNITIQTGIGDPVAIGREVRKVLDSYNRRAA